MKKILGLVLLGTVLCTGVAMAQNTGIGSASLNWGMTREIRTDDSDMHEDSEFIGFSFAYTTLSPMGLALHADLSISFLYSVVGEDSDGYEYEIDPDDFEQTYAFNIFVGIGFAPINTDSMYIALTVGPNYHANIYETEYWAPPYGTITFTTSSLGLAANLGAGFNFGGGLYIVANVKAGYNVFGSYAVEIDGDYDSDSVEDFGMFFVIPSFGIGLRF